MMLSYFATLLAIVSGAFAVLPDQFNLRDLTSEHTSWAFQRADRARLAQDMFRAARASSDFVFYGQYSDSNCDNLIAGVVYETDLCFGLFEFSCAARKNSSVHQAFYNPFTTANCTGNPIVVVEYNESTCVPFDSGANQSSSLWVSFSCGEPDEGVFLISGCGNPNNFTTAAVLPVNECLNGTEYQCKHGATVVQIYDNNECHGSPQQEQEIAGPGECVGGVTFDCRENGGGNNDDDDSGDDNGGSVDDNVDDNRGRDDDFFSDDP